MRLCNAILRGNAFTNIKRAINDKKLVKTAWGYLHRRRFCISFDYHIILRPKAIKGLINP